MYYLADIVITRPAWNDESFQRIVKAKDKNSAYDKLKDYLLNHYISVNHPINIGFSYSIKVHDTIE